mmetsp:Transcript_110468/g.312359  ORF Transcript_110468/g.312359 Transcript_110468/m.312359 type:complete len:262 (+) Transcript_110468:628-1413(+)
MRLSPRPRQVGQMHEGDGRGDDMGHRLAALFADVVGLRDHAGVDPRHVAQEFGHDDAHDHPRQAEEHDHRCGADHHVAHVREAVVAVTDMADNAEARLLDLLHSIRHLLNPGEHCEARVDNAEMHHAHWHCSGGAERPVSPFAALSCHVSVVSEAADPAVDERPIQVHPEGEACLPKIAYMPEGNIHGRHIWAPPHLGETCDVSDSQCHRASRIEGPPGHAIPVGDHSPGLRLAAVVIPRVEAKQIRSLPCDLVGVMNLEL